MMKTNCWENKQCGREPGGVYVYEMGVCPAALEWTLNGAHGGKNAGRACWVIAGTFCGGEAQGPFAHKIDNCKNCGFFNLVNMEEHGDVCHRMELYGKMNLHLRKPEIDSQPM